MAPSRNICYIFVSGVGLLVLATMTYAAPLRPSTQQSEKVTFPVSDVPMGSYKNAAVACDNGYCSTIGKTMLEKGGSAVDAAIAAMFCDGVVNMQNLGIGGGGFTVVWDSKTRSAHAFDAYGTAPLGSSEEIYLQNPQLAVDGKYSITVPGHLAGVYELHSRFGRLTWTELIQPSIDLCENGFKIGPAMASGIADLANLRNATAFPEMKYMTEFLKDSSGSFLKENDTMKCPALANTLRLLAEEGPMSFYNGTLSELLLADFAELGVPITEEDLLSYKVTNRQPFQFTLPNGLTLYTARPGSNGAIAAFTLNILSGYKFGPRDREDPQTYYRYLEATNLAYAQLLAVGGEETAENEEVMEAHLSKLASIQFGEQLRQKINDSHRLSFEQLVSSAVGPEAYSDDQVSSAFDWAGDSRQSTSHISVLDEEGNAVSMTTTISRYFGSYVMGPRTGIVFNNLMPNFAFNNTKVAPRHNYFRPGRRPMTMVSPMIFVNHSITEPELAVRLVVGASGGPRIVSTVPYVAMRALWFGETVKEAVDAGRMMVDLLPNVLYHDRKEFPQLLLDYLAARGYTTQANFASDRHSVSQAIQRLPNETLFAMSDFRKEWGYTDGY